MSAVDAHTVHGTYAGWNKHYQMGIKPCDACQAAHRDYILAYRRRTSTKCKPGVGWPLRGLLPGDQNRIVRGPYRRRA